MTDQEVQAACSKVGRLVVDLMNKENNPVSEMAASMALSMTTLSVTAAIVMDRHNGPIPNPDHILFAALLIAEACHLNSSGQLAVEFSPEVVTNTLDQFEKFTGRTGMPLLDQNMLAIMKLGGKIDPSNFGANAKFLPH